MLLLDENLDLLHAFSTLIYSLLQKFFQFFLLKVDTH